MTRRCPTDEELRSYVAGTATGDVVASVESHISRCEECVQILSFLERDDDELLAEIHEAVRAPEHVSLQDAEYTDYQNALYAWCDEVSRQPRLGQALLPGDTLASRYRIIRLLGSGGFGATFEAFDLRLERNVVLKLPHLQRSAKKDTATYLLREARTAAKLRHTGIVPVHDVGQTEDGRAFIVFASIAAVDLVEFCGSQPLVYDKATRIIAEVAEALDYAHKRRVIHRDIKPANILIDDNGKAYVTDFGLALLLDDQGMGARFAGTPSYMSPEQARYEAHRVDCRSDIFSLGTVFYELLTGQTPFRGNAAQEILSSIKHEAPSPPRKLDDKIPQRLERICLRMLAKRPQDRYRTAQQVAAELRVSPTKEQGSGYRASRSSNASSGDPVIVPRGLRPFDQNDADFFLSLLPGPRDQFGIPESVRRWTSRIEGDFSQTPFAVGVIYGPSGCGKSSLMRAGILPRISGDVRCVYLEARPNDTERRLLQHLRPLLGTGANTPPDLSPSECLCQLRTKLAPARLLIVIDQFEQWLLGRAFTIDDPLVAALRQCDGEHIQCVLLVRDDFWMPLSRFMEELDVRMDENVNVAGMDLFPIEHAERVLAAFGRAYGRMPSAEQALKEGQRKFINQAVRELAQGSLVSCLRVALFAEMTKDEEWTLPALRSVGGASGIGVAFLERTFSLSSAHAKCRMHERAVRHILESLLPDTKSEIRAVSRKFEELYDISTYAPDAGKFTQLLELLVAELRIISPISDSDHGFPPQSGFAGIAPQRQYQLTHDFLVPSIRDWLISHQRQTRRGRAQLLLAQRAEAWEANPVRRNLPSVLEDLTLRVHTNPKCWTFHQKAMMGNSMRRTIKYTFVAILCFLGFTVLGLHTRLAYDVSVIGKASTADVSGLAQALTDFGALGYFYLRNALQDAEVESNEGAKLSAALAYFPAMDPDNLRSLQEQMLQADPEAFVMYRNALRQHSSVAVDSLWTVARDLEQPDKQRFRALTALAELDSSNEKLDGFAEFMFRHLLSTPVQEQPAWHSLHRPIWSRLTPVAAELVMNESTPTGAAFLADYCDELPEVFARLIFNADRREFDVIQSALSRQPPQAIRHLQTLYDQCRLGVLASDVSAWPEPSRDLVIRIAQADGLVTERFAFCLSLPSAEFGDVCEALSKAKFRPVWFEHSSGEVAAVWHRDGRNWTMHRVASRHALDDLVARQRARGLQSVHVAAAQASHSLQDEREYTVLFAERNTDDVCLGLWDVEYYLWDGKTDFPDAEQAGEPIARAIMAQLDFEWLPCVSTVPFENYWIRATCVGEFQNGDYEFFVAADDGTRFLVDGEEVASTSVARNKPIAEVVRSMSSGQHELVMEYCQAQGGAKLQLDIRRVLSFKPPAVADLPGPQFDRFPRRRSPYGKMESGMMLAVDDSDESTELAALGYLPTRLIRNWHGESAGAVVCWQILCEPKATHASQCANILCALLQLGESTDFWRELNRDASSPSSDNNLYETGLSEPEEEGLGEILDTSPREANCQGLVARHFHDPSIRSYLLSRLPQLPRSVLEIHSLLVECEDPHGQSALLIALAEFDEFSRRLAPAASRELIQERIVNAFVHDRSACVHSAAEYALRKWGLSAIVEESKSAKALSIEQVVKSPGERNWGFSSVGHTLLIIQGDKFVMGQRGIAARPWQLRESVIHLRQIDRIYAISSTETTIAQYRQFRNEYKGTSQGYDPLKLSTGHAGIHPNPEAGIQEARAYCNWLSERELIPPEQWCYIADHTGQLIEAANILDRLGYRLATEGEWEFACRGGSALTRCFGDADELLADYAWSVRETYQYRPVGSLRPNDAGAFDMHGNVREWVLNEWNFFPWPGLGPLRVLQDEPDRDDVQHPSSGNYVIRGADIYEPTIYVQASLRRAWMGGAGIRVARTIRPAARVDNPRE